MAKPEKVKEPTREDIKKILMPYFHAAIINKEESSSIIDNCAEAILREENK